MYMIIIFIFIANEYGSIISKTPFAAHYFLFRDILTFFPTYINGAY